MRCDAVPSHDLRKRGFKPKIVEVRSDLGGISHWNTYPLLKPSRGGYPRSLHTLSNSEVVCDGTKPCEKKEEKLVISHQSGGAAIYMCEGGRKEKGGKGQYVPSRKLTFPWIDRDSLEFSLPKLTVIYQRLIKLPRI